MLPVTSRPFPFYKFEAQVKTARLVGVPYWFGGKWTLEDPTINASRGGIDCSGWIRWAVYRASLAPEVIDRYRWKDLSVGLKLPDGSWAQHQWLKANCKPCTVADGLEEDGIIRFAYLSEKRDSKGNVIQPGHVMLIQNGWTIESHSKVGPDRRKWLSCGFMRLCRVYEFGVVQL